MGSKDVEASEAVKSSGATDSRVQRPAGALNELRSKGCRVVKVQKFGNLIM